MTTNPNNRFTSDGRPWEKGKWGPAPLPSDGAGLTTDQIEVMVVNTLKASATTVPHPEGHTDADTVRAMGVHRLLTAAVELTKEAGLSPAWLAAFMDETIALSPVFPG